MTVRSTCKDLTFHQTGKRVIDLTPEVRSVISKRFTRAMKEICCQVEQSGGVAKGRINSALPSRKSVFVKTACFRQTREAVSQMNTSPQWRDKIAAAVPATVDTREACRIVGEIEGREPSPETLRRWQIPYRLRGRTRTYEVDAVIAHARQRFEQAPIRRASRARQPA